MGRFDHSKRYMDELTERYPVLKKCEGDIVKAYDLLVQCFEQGGKILIAGNGGSCADANHIVGELMKGFCLSRRIPSELSERLRQIDAVRGKELGEKLQGALPAIALDNHAALNSAILNDIDGKIAYAQQVMGYGNKGDVFWGISTSGNSANILYAAITAKAKGLKVLGLTGRRGGKLKEFTDVCIKVDEDETYKIQELHLPIYHCLCLMVERKFYQEK